VIQVNVDGNKIHFKYSVGGKEKELIVPLDAIEGFETVINLNDVEKALVKMYEAHQAAFKDAKVYYGIGK